MHDQWNLLVVNTRYFTSDFVRNEKLKKACTVTLSLKTIGQCKKGRFVMHYFFCQSGNFKKPSMSDTMLRLHLYSWIIFLFSMLLLNDNPLGVTCLFLQLCHAFGTLYHLILDHVSVPQILNLFSKLILCHRFLKDQFLMCLFSFVLFLVLLRLEHLDRVNMFTL